MDIQEIYGYMLEGAFLSRERAVQRTGLWGENSFRCWNKSRENWDTNRK